MFISRAIAYPSEAPLRFYTLGSIVGIPTTRMEMLAIDKH